MRTLRGIFLAAIALLQLVALRAEQQLTPEDRSHIQHAANFSRHLQLRQPAGQRMKPHDVKTTTALLSANWVPVMLNARGSGAFVGLCNLNQQLRHSEPSAVPMFREWTTRSGCTGGNVQRVALEVYEEAAKAIKQRYDDNGAPDEGYPPYTLNGIIFHMMRTGSTLWGNMLARARDVLVYAEPYVLIDAVNAAPFKPARKAELLSLLFVGLSRVKGHNSMILKFPIAASPDTYNTMFAAFPNTPWVYIYRRPEEVLASMFRLAGNNPRLRAKRTVVPPCTRTHKSGSPPVVVSMMAQYGMQPRSSDPVAYCAAYLAMLCDAAQEADAVVDTGLGSLPPRPHAWFINYVSLPRAVLPVSQQLFNLRLSSADAGRVEEEGEVYSKSRGRAVGNRQEFKADAEEKRSKAPEDYHTYSAYFLYQRYQAMVKRSLSQPWVQDSDKAALEEEMQWVTGAIAKYDSVVANAKVGQE